MKFNLADYKGKYVMHCKTEEEAKSFCGLLHKAGRTWCTGYSYMSSIYWWDCNPNEGIYYNFNEGSRGSRYFYENGGYTILEWSDFMNNKFTKADLKTGDVILRRNGLVEIVNRELDMLICKRGWNNLDDVQEDLTNMDKEYDIIEVRRPLQKSDSSFDAFEYKYGILVYERQEPEEMTLSEVCKLLGREIKIVRE